MAAVVSPRRASAGGARKAGHVRLWPATYPAGTTPNEMRDSCYGQTRLAGLHAGNGSPHRQRGRDFRGRAQSSGDYGQYLVVAPPWFSLAQTVGLVDTAGGNIVDFGGLPSVVIVHSTNPRFARALHRAGAWLVIDPVRPRGCWGFERNRTSRLGGV